MSNEHNRRKLLRSLGSVGAASLAGCAASTGEQPNTASRPCNDQRVDVDRASFESGVYLTISSGNQSRQRSVHPTTWDQHRAENSWRQPWTHTDVQACQGSTLATKWIGLKDRSERLEPDEPCFQINIWMDRDTAVGDVSQSVGGTPQLTATQVEPEAELVADCPANAQSDDSLVVATDGSGAPRTVDGNQEDKDFQSTLHTVSQSTRFKLLHDIVAHPKRMPSLAELNFANPSLDKSTIVEHLEKLISADVVEKRELETEKRQHNLPHVFFAISDEGDEFLKKHDILRGEQQALRETYEAMEKSDKIERYEEAPRPGNPDAEKVDEISDEVSELLQEYSETSDGEKTGEELAELDKETQEQIELLEKMHERLSELDEQISSILAEVKRGSAKGS